MTVVTVSEPLPENKYLVWTTDDNILLKDICYTKNRILNYPAAYVVYIQL